MPHFQTEYATVSYDESSGAVVEMTDDSINRDLFDDIEEARAWLDEQ